MKRFLIMSALGALLLAFTACGGNGATVATTPTPAPQQNQVITASTLSPTQDAIVDAIADAVADMQAAASFDVQSGYYTFGDSLILWDMFDITFGSEASFIVAELTEGQRGTPLGVYHGEHIIMIPISITNITDNYAALFTPWAYTVMRPGEERSATSTTTAMSALFFENGTANAAANNGIAPGNTIDIFIHMHYIGDGDYTVTMEGGVLGRVHFRFPITMP